MNLRAKLSIYFLLSFFLITLLLSISVGFYFYNTVKDEITTYLFTNNEAKAEHINTFLEDQKEMSIILAAASVYRDFLKESPGTDQYSVIEDKIGKRLVRTINEISNLKEVFILDKRGKVVASSIQEEEGEDDSQDLYFTQAQTKTYIKSIFFADSINNELAYSVSSPVIDDDGTLLGVSVLLFSPESFYNIVQSGSKIGESEESFLIDKDKYFLTPSSFLGNTVILKEKVLTDNANNCFLPEEIDYIKNNGYVGFRDFSGQKSVVESKDYRNADVIGTHIYIPETGWCLITDVSKLDLFNASKQLVYILTFDFIASLFLFLFVSSFVIRIVTKPIVVLMAAVKRVGVGDLNVKIDNKSNDEMGILSRNFESMILSVKESRSEVDKKVETQTKEIVEKQKYLESQQKATLNVLQDIEEEKTKTEALLAGIGEGVIATDINTNVIFINKSAEDLIGWKSEEIIGKSVYNFLTIVDEKNKAISAEQRPFHIALETGKKTISSPQKSYYYTKRNGENFPVSISVTPVLLNNKIIGAINVFRDITNEKAIDKAKTEFVSLASHQLRTPLSSINWYTEMLLAGDAGKINKGQKQFLEEVYRSNKRMVDLVNALLNVSRIDLGTFAIVPEPCDFVELSKSVLSELIPGIKTKKMEIEEVYDKNLPKINADPKLARIIFQNLLSNAVKYTPEKGKISVFIKKQDKDILITIKDTGYGIPKKDQPRMFEKLFRADNVRQKDPDGTGLGLYILRSILAQSGGKIWFESEENKGTTFYVTIPLSGMKAKEGTKGLN